MDSIPSPTPYSLNLNDEIVASELHECLQSRARAKLAMRHARALALAAGAGSASSAAEEAGAAASSAPSRRGRPPNRLANQGFAFALHPPDESEDNDAQEVLCSLYSFAQNCYLIGVPIAVCVALHLQVHLLLRSFVHIDIMYSSTIQTVNSLKYMTLRNCMIAAIKKSTVL